MGVFGAHPAPADTVSAGRARFEEAVVLYLLGEAGERIGVGDLTRKDRMLDDVMQRLYRYGLIDFAQGDREYVIAPKGREALGKLVAMTDGAMRFEVFGSVNVAYDIRNVPDGNGGTVNYEDPNDPFQVVGMVFDPRFAEGGEDMRLAMYTFLPTHLADKLNGAAIDCHLMVLLQMVGKGTWLGNTEALVEELVTGRLYAHVDNVVQTAYKWTDFGTTPEDAAQAMLTLYKAGMTETRKRVGDTCTGCGAPLAIADELAKADGVTLDACPACAYVFTPPAPPQPVVQEYTCPACSATVLGTDRSCRGCGAEIDFGGVAGSVTTETRIVEEVVSVDPYFGWTYANQYRYVPITCGWYNDPYRDLALFTALTVAIWW